MELTSDQYKKVQQYLDEKMTPDEEEIFMEEVSTDPALQEYLQFEIEFRENLFPIEESVTGQTISFSQPPQPIEEKPEEKSPVINIKAIIAVAASLVLGVIGFFYFSSDRFRNPELAKKNDTQAGTNSHALPLPDTSQTKTPSQKPNLTALYKKFYTKDKAPEDKPNQIAMALLEYETGKYRRLQELDLSHLSSDRGPDSDKELQRARELGHYYKGQSFMETNNFKQAIENLDWVVKQGKDKQLKAKANWYQALIYVKQGETNKAIPQLTALSSGNSLYAEKARNLLQAIR